MHESFRIYISYGLHRRVMERCVQVLATMQNSWWSQVIIMLVMPTVDLNSSHQFEKC